MSTENEAVVQRWWEQLWNRGDLAVADEIVAPDFTDHDPASPWVPPGLEGCKTLVTGYRTVFPDIHFAIEQQLAVERVTLATARQSFAGAKTDAAIPVSACSSGYVASPETGMCEARSKPSIAVFKPGPKRPSRGPT